MLRASKLGRKRRRLQLTTVKRETDMTEAVTPRRITPDAVIVGILAAVATGMSLDAACRNAGVSRQSFYIWMQAEPGLVNQYAEATKRQITSRFSRD